MQENSLDSNVLRKIWIKKIIIFSKRYIYSLPRIDYQYHAERVENMRLYTKVSSTFSVS